MYKEDLALNNLQWLICHKTQPNLTFITLLCGNICNIIKNNFSTRSPLANKTLRFLVQFTEKSAFYAVTGRRLHVIPAGYVETQASVPKIGFHQIKNLVLFISISPFIG